MVGRRLSSIVGKLAGIRARMETRTVIRVWKKTWIEPGTNTLIRIIMVSGRRELYGASKYNSEQLGNYS